MNGTLLRFLRWILKKLEPTYGPKVWKCSLVHFEYERVKIENLLTPEKKNDGCSNKKFMQGDPDITVCNFMSTKETCANEFSPKRVTCIYFYVTSHQPNGDIH